MHAKTKKTCLRKYPFSTGFIRFPDFGIHTHRMLIILMLFYWSEGGMRSVRPEREVSKVSILKGEGIGVGTGFRSARGRIPVGSGPDSRPRARERGARELDFPRPVSRYGPGPGRGPGPHCSRKSAEIMNFMELHELS